MAINKKLIHFKTKQKFEEELANGNILDTSIVFILDTTEIYTHGQYYGDFSGSSSYIKLTNKTANTWVEDATYSDFGYKCDISCEGVTTDMYAEVVFNVALATSGNYSPVCETGNGIVTIWSSVTDSITIPTIIIVE